MNVSLFAALVFVTTIVAPALSMPVGYALCSLVILLSRLIIIFWLSIDGIGVVARDGPQIARRDPSPQQPWRDW